MKIGVSTEEMARFRHYRGHYPIHKCVIYNVSFPEEVNHALGLMRDFFGKNSQDIPIASQHDRDHGKQDGLDFRENESEEVSLNLESRLNFNTRNLIARVSIGMPYIRTNKGQFLYDSAKQNRIHLNVLGERAFLPKNFREIGNNTEEFSYCEEAIHFSLRWLEGAFDNSWESPEKFDEMRTNYIVAKTAKEYRQKVFMIAQNNKEPSIREEVCNILGTRRKAFSFKEDISQKIGRSNCLEVLSEFGDVSVQDANKIPKMNIKEGTDYIFGRVLPAMQKYTLA